MCLLALVLAGRDIYPLRPMMLSLAPWWLSTVVTLIFSCHLYFCPFDFPLCYL
jgi:hypothetical protein